MPQPPRLLLFAARFRVAFLASLLIIALGVTAVVTRQAHVASKEHREIVERVMRDYVAWAGFQLGNATKNAMFLCGRDWLEPITSRRAPVGIAELPLDACGSAGRRRFELFFGARPAGTAESELDLPLLAWLRDTVSTHPVLPLRTTWSVGFLINPRAGQRELVSYVVERVDGKPVRAVGFVDTAALDTIMSRVVATIQLLPPEMTEGTPDSMLFAARLGGRELIPAARRLRYAQTVRLEPEFADLVLAVSLKPASLNRIVPGGLPRNRGFELLSLFGLALGLVLSSLLLLKRESQLAQTRARFVSSVSHELRTPLAQIRMFAEMLLLGRVRSELDRRRSLEIIDKEARRLTQLIDNVLQVARSENGAVHVNPTQTRIAPVVREVVETYMTFAEARRIDFRIELQEDLIAPIDTAALRQIIVNLLDNAAKYGPAGQRVTVGLALFGSAARLWVDDEGPGVPLRERERVFTTFYRAQRDYESSTTGSGIGLSVVRELAALHGGAAWIEDAPVAGARVVVEMPGAYVAPEQPAGDWAVA